MALWEEWPAKALVALETSREGARGDEKDGGRTLIGEGTWPRGGAAGRHRTAGAGSLAREEPKAPLRARDGLVSRRDGGEVLAGGAECRRSLGNSSRSGTLRHTSPTPGGARRPGLSCAQRISPGARESSRRERAAENPNPLSGPS